MMIVHQEFFGFFIGSPQGIAGRSADLPEFLMFDGFPGNERHVVGGGIMVVAGKSVGIYKMGAGASQLCRPLVHQLRKSFRGSGYLFRNGVGTFVGGFQHDGIETFLYGQNLAFVSCNVAAVIFNGIYCIVGKGHFLTQVQMLQCQQHGHNLGNAGRIHLLIDIFAV